MLNFVPLKGTKSAETVPFKGIFEYLAYGYYPFCTSQTYSILAQVRDDTGGLRGLGKVEKVFLDNPNLMHAIGRQEPNIGNVRETFFYNQMRVNNDVTTSKESDFCIGEYTFEIGGRKKGKKQLEGVENGIVVRDDIEYGHSQFIPLWNFGLNY